MGYYTGYDLKIFSVHPEMPNTVETDIFAIAHYLDEVTGENQFDGNFSVNGFDMIESIFSASLRWYNHTQTMCYLSSMFPQYMFQLTGQGEAFDDNWVCYFFQGKCQKEYAQISFADFDVSKLKRYEG